MNAHSQTTKVSASTTGTVEASERYFNLEPLISELAVRATAMDRVKGFIREELSVASKFNDRAVLGGALQSLEYDMRVLMELVTDVAIMARGIEAAFTGEKAPVLLS
jgi:hypothetical protein